MARLTARLAALAAVAASAAGLSACGGGPNSDALAACRGVHRAHAAYVRSLHERGAAAAADVRSAERDLANVGQDAGLANSADGSYNALMTLLQQAQDLPLDRVMPALAQTCRAITSSTGFF